MDQIKIGGFIAELRKEQNLTQEQLAERIGVSNRSVSRWETGKNMPDISLFTPLCELLGISVNELICGERVPEEKIIEQSEINTVNVIKEHRKTKKWLKITIAVFLALIVAFGSWLGVEIYQVHHGVTYYKDIYTFDRDVKSVFNEIYGFLSSKGYEDFIVDFDRPLSIILNDGKVEDMQFEGSTKSTNTNLYFAIYSNDKKPDRLQIFSGELDKERNVETGILLSELIKMIDGLDLQMVLKQDFGNQIIIDFFITDFENETSINRNYGSPGYIVENDSTRQLKKGDVLNGSYVQIALFPNGGSRLATVNYKVN